MSEPKEPRTAMPGDKIKVHYTGTLKDGTEFDSSRERDPLEFTIGTDQLIKGFDLAVRHMAVGDKKTVEVSQHEGYGKAAKSAVVVIKKAEFPDDITPKVGQQLQAEGPEGKPINVRVTKIEGDEITLDGNHPLAGKTLIFDIELIDFVE